MKKRLTSFNIYSCKDDNLVFMTTIPLSKKSRAQQADLWKRPNGGKQKRAAARSRAHEVRTYAAHLRVRQTKPPTAKASFRPKKAKIFSLIS